MRFHPWSMAAFGVLAALASIAATSSGPMAVLGPGARPAAIAGGASLHAYGIRGAPQSLGAGGERLDGALNDIVRHAGLVRPGQELADLHALSPAARFRQVAAGAGPLVLVDAITRGDPQALKARLVALGMRGAAAFSNDVGGWLPVAQLMAAAGSPEVQAIRASMPRPPAAAVATQGDFAQGSDIIRSTYPNVTGAGITVGVLSDSFNCYAVYEQPGSGVPASGNQGFAYYGYLADYATDVSTGALPSGVNVLSEPYEGNCLNYGAPYQLPFTDEGRAMLQVVHVVAPGASLAFYTADNSEADFANGIQALEAAGARVEADDVGYFDEPFFQDGLLAQAIDTVESEGVAYFSAAGNGGSLAYENTTPSFATLSNSAPTTGEYLLNFDASGDSTVTSLPVTIAALYPGDLIGLVLEWDQPFVTGSPDSGGATSQLNLCVTGSTSGYLITDNDGNEVTSCTGFNTLGADPVQVLVLANPADAAGNTGPTGLALLVSLANGSPAPGRIKLVVEDNGQGSTINGPAQYSSGPTIQGHPSAAGAMAVGAAFFADTPLCGTSPAVLESFSSQGGDPILFSSAGVRLGTPIIRTKPDFVGPDGVNTTFFGAPLSDYKGTVDNSTVTQCQNNANYPNYFGTSAATPHAAGAAALMMQANSALTPTQIYDVLQTSALPMGNTTPNDFSGWGFMQADLALSKAGGPSSSSSSSSSGGSGSSGSSSGGGGGVDPLSLVALAGLLIARRRRVT